jgi:hypothetical protein
MKTENFSKVQKRIALAAVVAVMITLAAGKVDAVCGSGRVVIVGQLPDVFFVAGQTASRTFHYTYKNVGGGWNSCGISAQSMMTGVAVVNSYGNKGHEAYHPEVTGVGIAIDVGELQTGTIELKALASAPPGAGIINVYTNNANDVSPPNYVLIGRVNVYIVDATKESYLTTFVVKASVSNRVGTVLYIDHPATNGNPWARLIVTPNWNLGGAGGVYNNHFIGVYYAGSTIGKWAVFNEDSGEMPIGASFNVRIGGPASLSHTANSANILGNCTVIDDPVTNDNPNALVFVTHNWNPGGGSGRYNNHNLGVSYNGSRWTIFNQDGAAMRSGLNFTVQALGYYGDNGLIVHTASAFNMPGPRANYTWIDSPLTDSDPRTLAFVLITPNANPGSRVGTTYVFPPIGVWYDANHRKWSIFYQDGTPIPFGTSFNVLVPVKPVYGQ